MENDFKKVLDAYIQEFGKGAVILELPKAMQEQAAKHPFDVTVQFIDCNDKIKIRSGSACYEHRIKGLDKNS